jgi:histidine triad (HIT) family protein
MDDCIFCKVVSGELQANLVYESPGAVAFLDKHPSARGHTLVIPRHHAPTLLDLPDENVEGLFRAVKEVQAKVARALEPNAFHVGWNHGRAAGQHVFHLHVHVLPHYGSPGYGIQAMGEGAARMDLAAVAEAIRKA